AAIEALEPKRSIFEILDRTASPTTILATNTSALSVTAISTATADPGRVIGLHFFNPAPRMKLVEVVRTDATAPAVLERATGLMRSWGKTPVVCSDSPGFIVNRVNRPFTLEALSLLETGTASVPRIDGAVRDAGFPMGPFELMDLIGVDVNLAAARGLWEAMGRHERFRPSPIQERLVATGRLGRKSGTGFYRYDEEGRSIGPAAETEGTDDPATADAAIAERIVLAIVNEAFSALGDRVATEPDIDLALRLGAGHPVGPFERVAGLGGRDAVARRLRALATAGPRFEPSPLLAVLR
ncbi:MAG TPA: 3-hydroxyacyl-CoA dehydrogenase family protein, partial [Candidatus Acidoferrum sp.]|nr:3-hydroxyacyl-CoA dehydrogenase family protein [Candidatus Acidoferrum sp.]